MSFVVEKQELLREFSADPDRYYRVDLFGEEGFERRRCEACKRYFWTLDTDSNLCPDDAPDIYSFIGEPPARQSLDYTEAWRQVESFFTRNGHTSVGRYPVVCRWRDDLFFTIASIVDFQRVMGSGVTFEFPANPLVVPQTCLRFKDLENVGVTGRHFSSFCMIGQHAIPNNGGYWKDECVEFDYRLVTEQMGIAGEEVTFVEDVWAGGGSFGSSLEYFVRGLELGNAVFTEFQGELGRHTTLDQKIIDMGAGLERFAWITSGTPTAYDCCFGPVMDRLFGIVGADPDADVMSRYFVEIARIIDRVDPHKARLIAADRAGITQDMMSRLITPAEGAYLIADHLRTLIFAIVDGALPSNVGGGYNLRIMLRRIIGTAARMGINLDIPELVDLHIDYLRMTYPELDGGREDVKTILGIESQRYTESRSRMARITQKVEKRDKPPTVDELITLYESDGITPDYLIESSVISEVPSTFYTRLAELHRPAGREDMATLHLEGLGETEPLYYAEDPTTFEANVLRVIDDMVILDRTSFYPRGGGQEPDHGEIDGLAVTDVQVHAGVILHRVKGGVPAQGQSVMCRVDRERRRRITGHHTATHILNASSRKVLGSWIWQHSAYKDADHARLDITHHSPLTDKQRGMIEDEANQIISENLPVTIESLDRGIAEQRYGFRIYQGGVVPVKSVRVVSIQDRDIEACGGTHVRKTGEIGSIRITKTKRIQDGVVRLEFVAGKAATRHDDITARRAARDAAAAKDREHVLAQRESQKRTEQHDIPILLAGIAANQEQKTGQCLCITIGDAGFALEECDDTHSHKTGIERWQTAGGWFYRTSNPRYGERFHVKIGRKITSADPHSTYCGLFRDKDTARVIVCSGSAVQRNGRADVIAKAVSRTLGGSGGGVATFAQGGGKDTSKIEESLDVAKTMAVGS